jgi:hypothetical protein
MGHWEKITSDERWNACFPLASSSLMLISKKTPKSFFRLGAPFFLEFEIFIQKEEMFEL